MNLIQTTYLLQTIGSLELTAAEIISLGIMNRLLHFLFDFIALLTLEIEYTSGYTNTFMFISNLRELFLRKIKYILLLLFVILIPIFYTNVFGPVGYPFRSIVLFLVKVCYFPRKLLRNSDKYY